MIPGSERSPGEGNGNPFQYSCLGKHVDRGAEFQKMSRRNKKAFLSEQCKKKKKKENNRMEKTRDLFKKIRDTKGTFQAKMGTIKDRNSMDLTEAKDIK